MTTPGSRVFAIKGKGSVLNSVAIYGHGVYLGDHPRPGSGPPWAQADYEMAKQAIVDLEEDPIQIDEEQYIKWLKEDRGFSDEQIAADRALAAERSAARDALSLDEKIDQLLSNISKNPKILLDNGKVVWGCECWWGPEEQFEKYKDYIIEEADIEADRNAANIAEGRNLSPLHEVEH